MNIIAFLNISGLVINMLGAYLMYDFTPKVNSQVYLYRDEEMKAIRKKDQRSQTMIRRGILLLFIGFILQLVALLIDSLNLIHHTN